MKSISACDGGERGERSGERREFTRVILMSSEGQAASSPRSMGRVSWGPEKPARKAEATVDQEELRRESSPRRDLVTLVVGW
jgi:hypothetical protein